VDLGKANDRCEEPGGGCLAAEKGPGFRVNVQEYLHQVGVELGAAAEPNPGTMPLDFIPAFF